MTDLQAIATNNVQLIREKWEANKAQGIAKGRDYYLNELAACVARAVQDDSQRCEKEREALRQIDEWAKAYPLDVFPEPDLKRAHEVLESAGLSLGAISGHAMRHVLTGVQKIVAASDLHPPRNAQ